MKINWVNCDLPYYHPEKIYFNRFYIPTAEEKFYDQLIEAELKVFTEKEREDIRDLTFYENLSDEERKRRQDLDEKYNMFYYEWRTKTKEVVLYEREINNAEKRWNKEQDRLIKTTVTFCGSKLNKPGTLIKLSNRKVYLIGNVIPTGCIIEGESDFGNMKEIPRDARVIKYCHLLDLKNIEEE